MDRAAFPGGATTQFGIITPDGFLRISNTPLRGPVHLGDREHFQIHVDSRDDHLFISKPIISRQQGISQVRMTRGMRKPDGSFAGVIGASFDPYHFARFYETIDVGTDGLVAVIGLDGVVRAYAGRGPDALGQTVGDLQLLEANVSRNPSGWYFSDGAWAASA